MPAHRRELELYGLPLPPSTTGVRIGARQSPVQAALARFRQAYAPQRLPLNRKTVPEQTATDTRGIMALISDYAQGRRLVQLTYSKATENGKVVVRLVEPYSVRYRDTRHNGRRRYVYCWCSQHQGIHAFIIDNIISAKGTSGRFIPRWKIEIGALRAEAQ